MRLNLNGALDVRNLEVITSGYERLNAESTIDFFSLIESQNPKAKNI